VEDEARMAALRVEISARLKNICRDMPETEFAALVEGIATHARKSETRMVNWGSTAPPVGGCPR
jgi:hypothetical protein